VLPFGWGLGSGLFRWLFGGRLPRLVNHPGGCWDRRCLGGCCQRGPGLNKNPVAETTGKVGILGIIEWPYVIYQNECT